MALYVLYEHAAGYAVFSVKEKGKRTYKVLRFFGVSKEEAGENGKEKVKGAGIFDPFGRIRVRNCKRRSSRGVSGKQ